MINKFNKKNFIIVINLALLFFFSTITFSAENSEKLFEEKKIKIEEKYKKKFNVSNLDKLPKDALNNLTKEIENLKNDIVGNPSIKNDLKKNKSDNLKAFRSARNPYVGHIYVTYDTSSGKFDWFGHAAIGAFDENATYEVTPSEGATIKYGAKRRWDNYKSGGRFKVRRANSSHYEGAASYAHSRYLRRMKYSIKKADGINYDYCSGYVHRAWKSVGFNIGGSLYGPYIVAPRALATDFDVYMVEAFE